MNEKGNEVSIRAETVPAILDMEPKKARRAWARWMADHDFDVGIGTELFASAELVRISIDMVILNLGRDAEPWAQKNLAEQFAKFGEFLRLWRG